MRAEGDATATGAVILLWFVSTLFWLTPGITLPDGAGYFVYLPSVAHDADLLFFDQWQTFGMIRRGIIEHKEITATDHLGNHWTVGSAIAWAPAFAAGEVLRAIVPTLRKFGANGITLPYNACVATASAIAGLVALLLSLRAARSVADHRTAFVTVAAVWFGSTLMWYSLKNPIMSHAVSAASCAAVVLLSMGLRGTTVEKEKRTADLRWFFAGVSCGFAIAARPQNATFALVPLIVAGVPALRASSRFVAGILLGMLPQLVVSSFLYGSPVGFLTGGGAARPFAAFERIWVWEPIFSWYHGLVPWTPLLGVGALGLAALYWRDRRLALAGMWAFGSQWAINALLERSFWGAYAFGQRRFDNCTIFFALGLAALFARMGLLPSVVIAAGCCLWTMSIFFASFDLVDLNAYYTPSELLQLQGEALSRLTQYVRPFSSVPSGFQAAVFLCIAATVALYAVILLIPVRVRPAIGVAVLVAVSMALVFAGLRGVSRIGDYDALIARNRFFGTISGGADARIGLLASEADYLAKIGRSEEAARVRAEALALQTRRNRALEIMESAR